MFVQSNQGAINYKVIVCAICLVVRNGLDIILSHELKFESNFKGNEAFN